MSSDNFSRWLVRQLERREMQPADFARALDVSPGVVSNWLRAKRKPSPESCQKIADALHFDLDVVLDYAGHRPQDDPIDADDPKQRMAALARRVKWTPEREYSVRRMLEGFIEFDRKGDTP